MKLGFKFLMIVCFAALISACSSSDDAAPAIEVEQIAFEQETYRLMQGEEANIALMVKLVGVENAVKVNLLGNNYRISASTDNAEVALIQPTGKVKGLTAGETTLRAVSPLWNGEARAKIVVAPAVEVASLRFAESSYETATPEFTPTLMVRYSNEQEEHVYDMKANELNITYDVQPVDVAEVSAQGVVKFKKEGRVSLVANTAAYTKLVKTSITYSAEVKLNCTGEWALARWNNETALAEKIYLELKDDKTFVLYQNLQDLGFQKLTGDYRLKQKNGKVILTGQYADTTFWGDDYAVEVEGDKMILTGVNTGYVSEYVRKAVPDYIKQSTRAMAFDEVRFL